MYGETFYGRHTAQHQLQWSQIKYILYFILLLSMVFKRHQTFATVPHCFIIAGVQ